MDTDAPRGHLPSEPPQFPDGAGVPELEGTGNADVDAALERLRELSERPVRGHAELYDDVHQRLQDVLAEIDQRQHDPAGR